MKIVTMVYADNLKEVADAIYNSIPGVGYFAYDKELARLSVDTDKIEKVSAIVSAFSGHHLTWLE